MPANRAKREECLNWYMKNRELYNACGSCVQRLLTTLLSQANIPVHSIQYRIKERDSFLDKCLKDRYTHPLDEITDVCGIRIITYTNSDVKSIRDLIETHFSIDADHSEDKAEKLQENEVGYLSVHYIAKLNSQRVLLEEYKPYRDICFEIQVRTLLQHAWAEIEHDRSYKFGGELPKDVKRRFYLIAGTLELMDREFDLLAREIEDYAKKVHAEAKSGTLSFAIDSTSLSEYLKVKLKAFNDIDPTFCGGDKELIQELTDCEIHTLAQLDELMDSDILMRLYEIAQATGGTNYIGFLRGILMVTMPKKYFQDAWKHHWAGIYQEEFERYATINPEINQFSSLLDFVPFDPCFDPYPDYMDDIELL